MNILKAYKVLFDINKNDEYKVLVSKKQKLRFVKKDEFTLMEQNKNRNSVYADLARNGHKVAWLFKSGKYVAVVIDGVVSESDNPMIREVAVALSLLSNARNNTNVYTALKRLNLQI